MNLSPVKKLLLLAAGLALAAAPVLRAEEPKPEQPRGERRGPGGPNLEMLAGELGLSADQKAQLAPAFKQQMEQARAVREDQSLSREQRMEKMKAIRDEWNKALEAVLTPEQMSKFKDMREKMRERGGQRGERPARDKN